MAGMMDNESAPMDAGNDGSELADLEARVAAIEKQLGMGQDASPAAPPSFGAGNPAMGGKPASPFYGG